MLIESRSIDYIPLAERHGKVWQLWPVWFSGGGNLATVATGFIGLALHLSLVWSAAAIVTGCALGTFFMAFHATQGPQLGLPQMIQSRPQFGHRGALLVWLVALVTFVGYNAFNQVLAGDTIHQMTGAPSSVGMLGFTVLSLAIAVVGHDWIHRAQRLLAYLLIATLLVFTVYGLLFLKLPGGFGRFLPVPFLTQFFAAAAYQMSWSIYVSDYSRYLPRDVGVRASFLWTYFGALIGGAWMMLAGAMVGALQPGREVGLAVAASGDAVTPGFGTAMLAVAMLGLVTITSLNYYGASLTLLSIADSIRPLRCTAAKRLASLVSVAAVATLIASLSTGDFQKGFEDLLSVLLYLFTPWTAINLVDFYVVRHAHYSVREIFNPRGMYGQWNWRGLVSYAAGFAAMVPFFSTSLYEGPIARMLGGADIAMAIGLPVAAFAYLLACRSLDVAEDRRLALAADRGLEPGL